MGWLDPLFDTLAHWINEDVQQADGIDLDLTGEDVEDLFFDTKQDAGNLVESFIGDVGEEIEQDLTENFRGGETLTPGNIEGKVNTAEGEAISYALTNVAAGLGIEIAGATQLETHQFGLSQIIGALALEDIVGHELAMYTEKGVNPALEAKVGKETRSEFVSVQDAHEYALRMRESDEDYLHLSGAPPDVVDKIGSNQQVSDDNLLEEWGLRDDQLDILEEVGLATVEAEELMETPMQMGVYVDPELVERNAKREGLPQEVIDVFVEAAEVMPRSSDMWEQKTALEPVVSELDALVSNGEISPAAARASLPAEADEAGQALQDRWAGIDELPNKNPTRSQLTNWFTWGLIDRSTFVDGLSRVDVDPNKYPAVVAEAILSEIDGDLRTALGIGLLDENRYSQYARTVGLDQSAIQSLMTGAKLKDIGISRASEKTAIRDRPTTVVIDIGTSRAAALEGAGIETVGDLASADPSTVANVTDLVPDSAATLVSRAREMVN